MNKGDLVRLKEPRGCTVHALCSCPRKEVLGLMWKPPEREGGWATILWEGDGFLTENKENYELVKEVKVK